MYKKILIAEDHTIMRDGLKALIATHEEYTVVGEACDGLEAVRVTGVLKPDLVLMDLTMPKMNGVDAIKNIKKACPQTKILVLTVHKAEEYVLASLRAGADGYLLKDSTHSELINAIGHVLNGNAYISPGVSGRIIQGYLNGRDSSGVASSLDMLTQREREILKLVAEGYKNREIADFLCISVKTVEKHRDNLMKKTDRHNASALTALAIESGLVNG